MNKTLKEMKSESRKKFLKTVGILMLIPLFSKLSSAKLYLRKENSETIDFDDIEISRKSASIKSNDYTMVATDHLILIDSSSNSVTITLPSAIGIKSKIYNIKCIDSTNQSIIIPQGLELIDNLNNNFRIYKDECVSLQSDGSGWWII
jgi:hypothetical protein